MANRNELLLFLAVTTICLCVAGCSSSSPTSGSPGGNGNTDVETELGSVGEIPSSQNVRDNAIEADGSWKGYPDLPYVESMTDVDGVQIPRAIVDQKPIADAGEIPADVGNEFAKQQPDNPVTGGSIIIRFTSEPKTLNPINETSSVLHVMSEYFLESLAKLNKETVERDPLLAEKWAIEDSIKLSPDYKGLQRRIRLADAAAKPQLDIEYQKAKSEDQDDPKLTFTTTDLDGQLLGKVWVGLYPTGEGMVGAPRTGYHYWSDADGKLEVQSIVSGKYQVRVGAEVLGKSTVGDDGSLTVTPATSTNPLSKQLQSSAKESLTLAKDEWIERHEQTSYTYFLKKNIKWSDGTPFTTKDLVFAYAVINNQYVDGESIRVYYQDLVECDALDDYTIRMQYRQQYFLSFDFTADLSEGCPPWHLFEGFFQEQGKTLTMERLTAAEEQRQNKVSVHGQVFGKFFNTDSRYNDAPIGTGPYIVDKWERTDFLVLRRNPNYWNPDRPAYLDRIIIKFIPDNVTAMQALKSGEIDFLYRMDAEQYFEDLRTEPDWFKNRYVKAAYFVPQFGYVGWNQLKPKFQDRRVRIALSLLFDCEEFVEKKLNNSAALVSGSQFYFGTNYDHSVKPLGYDPETARQLLADAGWADTDNDGVLDLDGERFEFEFLLPPGSPVADDRAALIQRSFKDAGIVMHIRHYEWASFLEKIKGKDYDVVNLAWISPPESDPYQIWHSSGAGFGKRSSNHVSFDNPIADDLIERLRLTIDQDKRKRLHWALHRVLDREQPYMFLYTPKEFAAYHRRYKGVKWLPIRPGFDLTYWYIPKELQAKTGSN